jgi:hypothetical protein
MHQSEANRYVTVSAGPSALSTFYSSNLTRSVTLATCVNSVHTANTLLDLFGNKLTGQLPASLLHLTSLQVRSIPYASSIRSRMLAARVSHTDPRVNGVPMARFYNDRSCT